MLLKCDSRMIEVPNDTKWILICASSVRAIPYSNSAIAEVEAKKYSGKLYPISDFTKIDFETVMG